MSIITRPCRCRKGSGPSTSVEPPDSPADRLLALARQVERLAMGGRTDPEQVVLGKLGIASEMRALAKELP
jgi:hypothetical protein